MHDGRPVTLREYRENATREYLQELVRRYRTPTKIAEAAGIHRSQVYRLCADLGVSLPRIRGGGGLNLGRSDQERQRLTADRSRRLQAL